MIHNLKKFLVQFHTFALERPVSKTAIYIIILYFFCYNVTKIWLWTHFVCEQFNDYNKRLMNEFAAVLDNMKQMPTLEELTKNCK